MKAAAQQAALPGAEAKRRQIRLQFLQARRGVFDDIDLLFGKIECCFDQHAQFDQALDQGMNGLRKLSGQRTQRSPNRLRRRCLNQVGNRLGLCEIELVVEICAAGKFARLCKTRAKLKAAGEQELQNHRAAVSLEFQHIFAGEGIGRRKVEQDSLVEGDA